MRKATGDEIDIEGATWTVLAARMKANREHRVPLSALVLQVLAEATELSDGSGSVLAQSPAGLPVELEHSREAAA